MGDPANILQKGSVNVWKNSDCQKSFREKGSDIIVTEKQMCAGYVNGGIDSCWVSISVHLAILSSANNLRL